MVYFIYCICRMHASILYTQNTYQSTLKVKLTAKKWDKICLIDFVPLRAFNPFFINGSIFSHQDQEGMQLVYQLKAEKRIF